MTPERLTKIIKRLIGQYAKDGITPKEINNGYCADFATVVWEKARRTKAIEFFSDEDLGAPLYTHTFIRFQGKYYDAECPNGVHHWKNLPIFRRGIPTMSIRKGSLTKEIWLDRQGKWGHFKDRKRFHNRDGLASERAEVFLNQHHPNHRDYGLFDNS